jgi:hypothetical protein
MTPGPPRFAETLLSLILPEEEKDAVLGDLAESYRRIFNQFGQTSASRAYWFELLRSSLPMLFLKFTRSSRKHRMALSYGSVMQNGNRIAFFGFALSIPALTLCFGGVLQSLGLPQVNNAIDYSVFMFNPALLLGGLTLAFCLNLLSVTRISYQDGSLVSELRIKGRFLNLSQIIFCLLLFSIIFLYFLAEELQLFAAFRN